MHAVEMFGVLSIISSVYYAIKSDTKDALIAVCAQNNFGLGFKCGELGQEYFSPAEQALAFYSQYVFMGAGLGVLAWSSYVEYRNRLAMATMAAERKSQVFDNNHEYKTLLNV